MGVKMVLFAVPGEGQHRVGVNPALVRVLLEDLANQRVLVKFDDNHGVAVAGSLEHVMNVLEHG